MSSDASESSADIAERNSGDAVLCQSASPLAHAASASLLKFSMRADLWKEDHWIIFSGMTTPRMRCCGAG
jgi:hypothetical protein